MVNGVRTNIRRPSASASRACGFALAELLVALTITSMLSVVLGGLIMAVQTARQHTEGVEEATMQAEAALSRMKLMVSEAGVYDVDGEPTTLGVKVVAHDWYGLDFRDVLVVWSGGQDGGQAAAGLQRRLPRIQELVVYAPDPDNVRRFVEFSFPESDADFSATIDFRAADFNDEILALIESADVRKTVLCDRLRRAELPGSDSTGPVTLGGVRFELRQTPADEELAAVAAIGDEDEQQQVWNALQWAQGIAAGEQDQQGLRQATLRFELQISQRGVPTGDFDLPEQFIPFFGSASYRYVYRP